MFQWSEKTLEEEATILFCWSGKAECVHEFTLSIEGPEKLTANQIISFPALFSLKLFEVLNS